MKFEKGVSNMATTLAERMSKFSGSPTSALIAKVAELKQQGKDIISLNVGNRTLARQITSKWRA